MTPRRQQNQHIAVTGASAGIGRAIALRLAAEGAMLSLLARREAELEETAALAREAGSPGVTVAPCDLCDRASIDAAFASGAAVHGPLRGAVANAGVGGPNAPGDEDRFELLVQTNLVGTYHCLRAAQRHLASDGPRHLVVMSSILGRIGVGGYTGYCASKTALLGLVRALSHEVAASDVQVNAICPGWVGTAMAWQGIDGFAHHLGVPRDQAFQQAMSAVPMGRMSRPEDVAGLVAWLFSTDARGVTGQGLDMNGGAWM
jgi:ketoreductase